nr:hypothetical protein [Chlamydiota bacterium]
MTVLKPVYYQYRTFDYSYLGKTKGESLSLKIFDISQKNVLKKIFPVQDLEISRVEQ